MAYKMIQRSLTAGVAIAGVSAISWSAVAVMPADEPAVAAHRVVTADVTPTGLASSLQLITEAAATTLHQSVDGLVTKLPALWNQVNVQWADADLTHWNYALVADSFLMPVAPLVFGPLNDAVAEAVARQLPVLGDEIRALPGMLEYGVVRLIGPLLSAIGGAGAAHAQIFYSMSNWELQPFFEAIVAAPGHVIDGLLFGGYGDLRPLLTGEVGGTPIPAPGLLTPWGQAPTPRDIKWAPDAPEAAVESDTVVDESSDTSSTPDEIVSEPVDTAGTELVEAVDPETVETVETVELVETVEVVDVIDIAEPAEAEKIAAEETAAEETEAEETAAEEAAAEQTEEKSSDSTRKRFGDSRPSTKLRDRVERAANAVRDAVRAPKAGASETGSE